MSVQTADATTAPPVGRSHRVRNLTVVLVMLIATATLAIVSAGIGQVEIPPLEVLGSIAHHFHLEIGPLPSHPNGEGALWNVRFPRIVLGLFVGAALGAAGCLLQGVLANPLAEPSIIGVSSGSAVGACLVIVLAGGTAGVGGAGGNWALAGAAFLFGLVTAAAVYLLSLRDGSSSAIMLVLTGIAVNAFAAGVIAFLTFVASTAAREQIIFWQLGSLAGRTWSEIWVVAPLVIGGVAACALLVHKLDLLALGEIQAASLGVNVESVRRQAIVLTAVLTAAAVAFAGIIAFVGLVVPHVMRLIVGPKHSILLPTSVIGGALVITGADLAARTMLGDADLPLGMFTSLIGGPVFFILLRRSRHAGAGW
ncbi:MULTISPECIES: FecCD family ABC transporter permease [Gordonia]|uniref:FecCD family ABC transporter permease n=1 Tax=Gordonia TaxID=2053 RepID=UPI000BB7C975|nr:MULTISPECIES: iron ABC transporter permease [Gordonia]ATD70610.1 heme ABC transporter permease [Gordonia sp. 1D]MBA5848728.1 iron ABC transporter permease [Gordonia amicalis]MDV7102214.1 iron ABC transporter permease [Gordonia amicalis]UKO90762.1 iron ABC transporter permease [Gordonia amicalis]UOG22281.1 iron ABC transporter permease [Gordonia amicalis]